MTFILGFPLSGGGGGTGGGLTKAEVEAIASTTVNTQVGKGIFPVENTAVGQGALGAIEAAGTFNTAVGYGAMNVAKTSGFTTAIGVRAGHSLTTGSGNVLIGHVAGGLLTSGEENTVIGTEALVSQTTQSNNTAIGFRAMKENTSGGPNMGIGYKALQQNSTGSYNVAIGNKTLENAVGSKNTAVGHEAGMGVEGTATGEQNVLLGGLVGKALTSGSENVGIGYLALNAGTTAKKNVAIGVEALTASTTGERNTVVGYSAAEKVSGNSNVIIGNLAAQTQTAISNKLWIDATNTATPLILGDFSAKTLQVNGLLTSNPKWTAMESLAAEIEAPGVEFNTLEATLGPDNTVLLRGALKCKTERTVKSPAATLPVGFRPSVVTRMVVGASNTGTTTFNWVIKPNGEIELQAPAWKPAVIPSFDGLSFSL